ncbi:MAG TPA: hypothetical protein VGK47_07655 [Nitrososphaeraceae archaeon]
MGQRITDTEKAYVNSIRPTLDSFLDCWYEAGLHVEVWNQYKDDCEGKIYNLLAYDALGMHRYNAAREYGLTEIEARYYALKTN